MREAFERRMLQSRTWLHAAVVREPQTRTRAVFSFRDYVKPSQMKAWLANCECEVHGLERAIADAAMAIPASHADFMAADGDRRMARNYAEGLEFSMSSWDFFRLEDLGEAQRRQEVRNREVAKQLLEKARRGEADFNGITLTASIQDIAAIARRADRAFLSVEPVNPGSHQLAIPPDEFRRSGARK